MKLTLQMSDVDFLPNAVIDVPLGLGRVMKVDFVLIASQNNYRNWVEGFI